MTTTTFILIVSFCLFAAYNIYVLSVFGIPANLSITYYHFKDKGDKLGFVFPLFLILQCCMLFPVWYNINKKYNSQECLCVRIIFFTLATIVIVILLPQYKKSQIHKILHYGAAILAAINSLLWILIACRELYPMLLLILVFLTVTALYTGTWKSCISYWLELFVFCSIYITLFTISVPF